MHSDSCNDELHRPGLDGWIPLALHSEDLDGAETQRSLLTDAIAELQADPQLGSPARTAAWAGDHWGSVELHHDPRLTWLCRSVAAATWTYLDRLGHDTTDATVHIDRAWGVASEPGQSLAAHAHHESDLTAVYYVTAPPRSGALRFVNTSRGTHRDYEPVAGRLIIFPSRQRHEVLPNLSGEVRRSISFELSVFKCPHERADACDPLPTSSPARVLPRPRHRPSEGVTGMVPLDELDKLDLPLTADATTDDGSATALAGLPPDPATWQRFHSAAVQLRDQLADLGVDGSEAEISVPSLSWRRDDGQGQFGTAPTELQIYLRIDDSDTPCAVEYEGDSVPVPLLPDGPVAISGDRRHRVIGNAVLLRFGCDVPGASDVIRALDDELARIALRDAFVVRGSRAGGHGHRRNLFPVG